MFKKYGAAHECSAKVRSKQQLMSQIGLPGLHHLAYYLPKHFCVPKHPISCQTTVSEKNTALMELQRWAYTDAPKLIKHQKAWASLGWIFINTFCTSVTSSPRITVIF